MANSETVTRYFVNIQFKDTKETLKMDFDQKPSILHDRGVTRVFFYNNENEMNIPTDNLLWITTGQYDEPFAPATVIKQIDSALEQAWADSDTGDLLEIAYDIKDTNG